MATDLDSRHGLPERFIAFVCTSPKVTVRAFPGDSAPTVEDGYASVETITRPQRHGLTRWTGSNPMQLSIPILLDGFRHGVSVEPEVADLEQLAGVGGGEPLRVAINSTGKLVPHEDDHSWFITGITWGDQVLNSRGRRVRVAATITVTAIVESALEKSIAKRGKKPKHHPATYRVKSGDTLKSIARKVLGDVGKWKAIKKINGISDPRVVGKPGKKKGAIGTVLKMPKG